MTRSGHGAINDSMGRLSRLLQLPPILAPMSEPGAGSILYRLIEAGQLTRRALLVPLLERGLEPGDDAVLFTLHQRLGATEAELGEDLGISGAMLAARLERLIGHDLVAPSAVGAELVPGFALTDRGERLREILAENWAELEAALLGELKKKKRKALKKTLTRFVALLRL